MSAVFKREINSYYNGVIGWLFAAFILLFAGIYTRAYNLSGYYSNFEYVLHAIGFIYLIAVPIITMRSVAEERRQKTDQLLYSLPISMTQVVLGKYFAMLIVLLLPTIIMGLYPLILTQFGSVELSVAYGALLGFFLVGSCLLAIGLFISATAESQVVAAVLTLVVMLVLYFMSGLASFVPSTSGASLVALVLLVVLFAVILQLMAKNVIITTVTAIVGIGVLMLLYLRNADSFSGLFGAIMAQLSVFDRFDSFTDGVFDLNAIVYYLSIAVAFLFLTVQAMEKRRWSE